MGASEVTSGRSAPLPARPRAGARLRGLLDRRRVGPATWFLPPTPAGEPGFLWKKAGGKNTRAERGSLRPGPTSLWSEIRESFFLYSETGLRPIFLTPVTARPLAGRAGKGRNFGTRCAGLPKLGMHPDPRQRSWHSRGEKYVLAGGAGQNMIGFSFPACGRGNSARRALRASPLGGRCPSAHTGADEGAIWYPTFPCRKEGATSCRLNEVFLLPRWATRSPPHPSPSVTASPQGEAFAGGTPPQRNAFSPKPCSRKMRIQIRARRWATK